MIDFNDMETLIKGYVPEKVDHDDRDLPFEKDGSGGVIIYISTDISYTHREDLESKNLESIWIELTPKTIPFTIFM